MAQKFTRTHLYEVHFTIVIYNSSHNEYEMYRAWHYSSNLLRSLFCEFFISKQKRYTITLVYQSYHVFVL